MFWARWENCGGVRTVFRSAISAAAKLWVEVTWQFRSPYCQNRFDRGSRTADYAKRLRFERDEEETCGSGIPTNAPSAVAYLRRFPPLRLGHDNGIRFSARAVWGNANFYTQNAGRPACGTVSSIRLQPSPAVAG